MVHLWNEPGLHPGGSWGQLPYLLPASSWPLPCGMAGHPILERWNLPWASYLGVCFNHNLFTYCVSLDGVSTLSGRGEVCGLSFVKKPQLQSYQFYHYPTSLRLNNIHLQTFFFSLKYHDENFFPFFFLAYTATASCVQIFYLPSLCSLAKPNLLTVLMKLIFDQCQKFFVAKIQSLTSMVYLGWVETLPGRA